MLVLGDSYSGRTALVRALAAHYLSDDFNKVNAVDIYSFHISSDGEFSFATEDTPESLRVWVLGAPKFYYSLHRSLIQKDTLALVVIDSQSLRASDKVKYWAEVCKNFGLTKVLTVFTKADKTDCTAELRATIPDSFFVSAKEDSEELSRLRSTIAGRRAESAEVPDQRTELLIKTVKVMTQLGRGSVSYLVRVAKSLGLNDPVLKDGIFLPDNFEALLVNYSFFLLTDSSYQSLSVQGTCRLCTYKADFEGASIGQCLSPNHGSSKCDIDCKSLPSVQLPDDFSQTCRQLLTELVERRVLYPVQLPNGRCGYFFPHLLESVLLPDPILRGIKVSYADSARASNRLVDEIFDLIVKAYPLAWKDDTRFASDCDCMKAQFSVEGVEGLIKLFEFKSFVILDLPPTLQVGNLLSSRFQWVEGVKPTIGQGHGASKKEKLVVHSKWEV